jgi:hypothetical protein
MKSILSVFVLLLTSFGGNALAYSSPLRDINLRCFDFREGVIFRYISAFPFCKSTAVRIPRKINGISVTSIYRDAFRLAGLTSVVIPDTVTTIGEGAFSGNELTSLEIPNSVESISDSAFYNSGKFDKVVIPNSVKTIGKYAFAFNGFRGVEISNSVNAINDYSFYANLITEVVIPNSVQTIGMYAFGSNELKSITIPSSVKEIEMHAFYCNKLTRVTFPTDGAIGTMVVGFQAFMGNHIDEVYAGWNIDLWDNGLSIFDEGVKVIRPTR